MVITMMDKIIFVNKKKRRVERTIECGNKQQQIMHGELAAVSRSEPILFVITGPNQISKLNWKNGKQEGLIRTPMQPQAVALSNDEKTLYVAGYGKLLKIDTNSNTVAGECPLFGTQTE